MIERLRCTAGQKCLVARNTTGDPCMQMAVGRYVVVVTTVHMIGAEPRWAFEGLPKPCGRPGGCAFGLCTFRDADLQPLPDPEHVVAHDAAAELLAPKRQDPVYK